MESNLKLYSVGIVIEAKQRGSDQIKVSPMEALPLQKGDMTQDQRTYKSNVPDATGVKRVSQVQGSNHIVAKWIPDGNDNRITSPDVQPGESVKIYRFADTDEYYWATMFREPKLRKLETVLTAVSNLPGSGTFNKDSAYWTEVSTHDSHIQVHTSQSNGEPYGYDIKLDAAAGKLTIQDTIGNVIVLDSAQSDVSITTNTSVHVKAPTVSIESTEINFKASTVNIEADDINLKGKVTIDKDLIGQKGAAFVEAVTAPNI